MHIEIALTLQEKWSRQAVAELGPNFWGGKMGWGRKNGLQADFREQFGPIHIENVHFLHGLGGPRPTLAPMKLRHWRQGFCKDICQLIL
jgi:hypothetical protein